MVYYNMNPQAAIRFLFEPDNSCAERTSWSPLPTGTASRPFSAAHSGMLLFEPDPSGWDRTAVPPAWRRSPIPH